MIGEMSLSDFWSLFGISVAAALVAAALCGYLGFFVVLRRIAFVSAALGQISGLGVACGFLVGAWLGWDPHEPTPLYLDPVMLAILFSAGAAALLGFVSRVQRTSPESTVAFAYLAASALALFVLAMPEIVQEAHEVGDLLFGNTVAVRREHLTELGIVAGVVLLSQVLLFKDLLFVSFDREMAQTLGLPVTVLDFFLHLSIGVSVTVCTRALGSLPVFSFLVLPAGAALLVSESVAGVLALSMVGAVLAAGVGFYLSVVKSWPTGPMMVLSAAAYWPFAALYRLLRGRR